MRNIFKKEKLEYTPVGIAIIFALCATIHGLSLSSPGYLESPLVPIVRFGLVVMFFMLLVLAILMFLSFFWGWVKRDWSVFELALLNFIWVALLTCFGFFIDGATTLHFFFSLLSR